MLTNVYKTSSIINRKNIDCNIDIKYEFDIDS